MIELAIALIGVLLIVLRRPLARVILEWRKLFPPRLSNEETKTGEIFLALLGVGALLIAFLTVVYG